MMPTYISKKTAGRSGKRYVPAKFAGSLYPTTTGELGFTPQRFQTRTETESESGLHWGPPYGGGLGPGEFDWPNIDFGPLDELGEDILSHFGGSITSCLGWLYMLYRALRGVKRASEARKKSEEAGCEGSPIEEGFMPRLFSSDFISDFLMAIEETGYEPENIGNTIRRRNTFG